MIFCSNYFNCNLEKIWDGGGVGPKKIGGNTGGKNPFLGGRGGEKFPDDGGCREIFF